MSTDIQSQEADVTDSDHRDLRHGLGQLHGLIPDEVGHELYLLAHAAPADFAIVEVGSYTGKSTCFLAAGSRDGTGAHIYAVDPWDLPGNAYGKHGYTDPEKRELFEFQLRAHKLWSRVTPVQKFSNDAAVEWPAGKMIGLLFIDGDHEEEAIRTDLAAWQSHLGFPHTIAFDDYETKRNPGVKRVVESLAGDYDVDIRAERLAVLTPKVL